MKNLVAKGRNQKRVQKEKFHCRTRNREKVFMVRYDLENELKRKDLVEVMKAIDEMGNRNKNLGGNERKE